MFCTLVKKNVLSYSNWNEVKVLCEFKLPYNYLTMHGWMDGCMNVIEKE